jgi:hypothetical protein
MPNTIFFSWQADTETHGGRNLIERALERAASRIGADTEVEDAIRDLAIDRDTKGVAGSPPIVDTIFLKIDRAAVFVPDLTFVGKRLDGRPTPNPNVLVEYGWALKSLTHSRIVPVMNTAYGEPTGDAMPFDMRHLRNPLTYECEELARAEKRKQVRDQLGKELESAIRAVLSSQGFQDTLPKPQVFQAREAADGRGRFKSPDEPVGLAHDFVRGPSQIRLAPGPAVWLRLMPTIDPMRTWSVNELETAMNSPPISPVSRGWTGASFLRSGEGYGVYTVFSDAPELARALVFGFTTGEIWSVDTYWLLKREGPLVVPDVDQSFRQALISYGKLLQKIGITPPYRWIAGMENLKGRRLYIPVRPGYQRFRPSHDGECLDDVVTETGFYSPGDAPGPALKPFFSRLYESCGVSRQDWQDQ